MEYHSLENISRGIVNKDDIRKGIMNFEEQLREMPESFVGDSDYCPLKHTFADGIYVREIFIPAGTFIVGKIHKHKHPNFLLSGEVDIVTESGSETLIGPKSIISDAGTKRALFSKTDVVWVTVHENPTNTRDLVELEKYVIADSYEEYDEFAANKNKLSIVSRFLNLFKKRR